MTTLQASVKPRLRVEYASRADNCLTHGQANRLITRCYLHVYSYCRFIVLNIELCCIQGHTDTPRALALAMQDIHIRHGRCNVESWILVAVQ